MLSLSVEDTLEHILWCTGHELILDDIVKAENCYLYDSKGNRFTDLESGVWCTSIGHNHPGVNKAIKSQLDKIIHTGYCYSNIIIEKSAKDILETSGFSKGKCVFLCSGSEAVEFGVRLAQHTSDRPLLLTMSDSYFGSYGSASEKTENEWYIFDWLKCADCSKYNECDPECDRISKLPFDKIGGFLFEPGSSSGLVRFPPKNLINNITKRIKNDNGLLIINEVSTGIGRTGEWYGYMHYNLQPDIVILGKGLGNGYPVSAIAITDDICRIQNDRPFKYIQSHQNDPLGAVIAREVIRIIREEKLIDRCKRIGSFFKDELKKLQKDFGVIKEIRGRGLMIAVDFNNNDFPASQIQKELLKRGFITANRPGLDILRIDPPLTINKEDIVSFIKCLKEILEEINL